MWNNQIYAIIGSKFALIIVGTMLNKRQCHTTFNFQTVQYEFHHRFLMRGQLWLCCQVTAAPSACVCGYCFQWVIATHNIIQNGHLYREWLILCVLAATHAVSTQTPTHQAVTKPSLASQHSAIAFKATCNVVSLAIESDTFRNKGEEAAVHEVSGTVLLI